MTRALPRLATEPASRERGWLCSRVAIIGGLVVASCGVDLFHSTDWSTECDADQKGCHQQGPVDGGDASSDGPEATIDSACGALASAECEAFARCSPLFFATSFAGDAMRCQSAVAGACAKALFGPGSSVSPESLLACVAAVNLGTASCANVERYLAGELTPPECRVPGALPEGAACVDARQCLSGVCSMETTDRCGTCRAVSHRGGACAAATDCELGLGCVGGLCGPLGDLGAGCRGSEECFVDLVCVGGACSTRADVGEPCDPAIQNCAAERHCNDDTMLCELVTTSDGGEACGVTADGGLASCTAFYACDIVDDLAGTGTCVPVVAEGMQCTFDDGPFGPQCEYPARCVEGFCYLRDGESCK